jgi:hypothetical protein
MQLDKIAITLRPRSAWTAIDLGFRMAATWARALWLPWLVLIVPFALALALALPGHPLLIALILWWLKPLWDRVLLHVLARATFGATPGVIDTLLAWREILSPDLLAQLTWRRLDPARAFHLPVAQLERQSGAVAGRRRRLLRQRSGTHAAALTLVAVNLEMVVYTGLATLGAFLDTGVQLFPQAAVDAFGEFDAEWWTGADTLLWLLAILVIEPFYVAAGFALYLNRRIELEGWDLELALRRIGSATAPAGRQTALAWLMAALLLGLAGGMPNAAHAQPEQPGESPPIVEAEVLVVGKPGREAADSPGWTPQATPARAAAEAVLADPAFGGSRERMRWRPISEADRDGRRPPGGSWLGEVFGFLAEGIRILAWLGLAALIVAVVLALVRRLGPSPLPERRAAPPPTLFGLRIDPASLPDDVAAAARAALAEGRAREALSLLYRGVLSQLVHRHGVAVPRGATEAEVGMLAARAEPVLGGFLGELLPAWSAAAYAGRAPETARIAALCERYPAASAAPAEAP